MSGVLVHCIGGTKCGEQMRISRETFKFGEVYVAVNPECPVPIWDPTRTVEMETRTFERETYRIESFVVNRHVLPFLVHESLSGEDATPLVLGRLGAMARMDHVSIRRRFWEKIAYGYARLIQMAQWLNCDGYVVQRLRLAERHAWSKLSHFGNA